MPSSPDVARPPAVQLVRHTILRRWKLHRWFTVSFDAPPRPPVTYTVTIEGATLQPGTRDTWRAMLAQALDCPHRHEE